MPAQPLDYQTPQARPPGGDDRWAGLSLFTFVLACACWASGAASRGYHHGLYRLFLALCPPLAGIGVAAGFFGTTRGTARTTSLIWAALNAIVLVLVLVYNWSS